MEKRIFASALLVGLLLFAYTARLFAANIQYTYDAAGNRISQTL
jgi:hypothetical protein